MQIYEQNCHIPEILHNIVLKAFVYQVKKFPTAPDLTYNHSNNSNCTSIPFFIFFILIILKRQVKECAGLLEQSGARRHANVRTGGK